VERNAEEWDNSYDEELRRVTIHGILHLSGMDHPGDDYSSGMLKLQEELLADSGSLLKDNQ
jgi:probable rRNA maturation factor